MEATDALNACFDCTDRDVFFDAESSLVQVVDRVTSYINFCIDVLVPVKEVKIHPNNKPWITRDIATLLMQRKQAFREGYMEETKNLRRKVRRQITENKIKFRNKVENSFKTNNSKQLWKKKNCSLAFNLVIHRNGQCTIQPRFQSHDPLSP